MSRNGLALPVTRPLVSRHVSRVVGGEPSVHAYYDEPEDHVVAIVTCSGTPSRELATVSTASLHVAPNKLEGDDIRVELLLVTELHLDEAANVLATAAFNVMKDGWLAAPGVVFPGAVREYYPRATTPHIMWTEPFVFPQLSTVHLEGVEHDVHWLQGVPLTEQERAFLSDSGFDALSARLEAADAPYYDVMRQSVV
jgi:hypothetical protein